MPAFVEALPARKSSKHSGIKWEPTGPAAGVLTIDTDRARVVYAVAEFATDWAGRAFHLAKLTSGTDREAEAYDVFVCDSGRDHRCDCRGFTRFGHCKHLDACLTLIENRWL